MAYRKYYEDKTTVVMNRDDREALEQLKEHADEPNAETLGKLIDRFVREGSGGPEGSS